MNNQAHVRNNVSEATLADYGWREEFWEDMLYVADNMPRHEWMKDPQILNNLGIVFTEGVGVEIDMERGIKYYEKAVMMDDNLARFNLAEIFSSGMNGVEVNYKRAYKLYRACGLPYAHFRLGEYFEYGTGVGVDIAMSQKYYRLAAEEGYEPAREKLQFHFDFLGRTILILDDVYTLAQFRNATAVDIVNVKDVKAVCCLHFVNTRSLTDFHPLYILSTYTFHQKM